MWDFIASCILFDGSRSVVNSAWDLIFDGYLIGVALWTAIMYIASEGDEKKIFVAYWGQALGSLLFVRLILGEAALRDFNTNKIHFLQFIPLAAIAVVGYRIFIDEMLDNYVGNFLFCLVMSLVYTIWAGTPSILDIVVAPIFVYATSYAVGKMDDHQMEVVSSLGGLTLLLGISFYFFVLR